MNAVNPSHYRGFSNGAEVIDIIEHLAANRANAIKYLARAGRKDDELQELSKALWYVAREILRIGGQEALSLAVKELPGRGTELSDFMSTLLDSHNIKTSFDVLGEDERTLGVVYEDNDGDFWTWKKHEWFVFDPKNRDWGWYEGTWPDDRFGPYQRTSHHPVDLA